MNIDTETAGEGTRILKPSGELTVSCAAGFRDELLNALSSASAVEVDLSGVSEMDLSALQLLCSAHRTSVSMNRRLRLSETRPPAFEKIVRDAGYTRSAPCTKSCGHGCLWTEGD